MVVKMVSQGAQTNGGLNGGGRKLTKSLSEAGDRIQENGIDPNTIQPVETGTSASVAFDHELLHRTQSEEPPKSPYTITSPPASHVGPHFELPSSRTSSQLSHSDGTHLTHSRNHSQDSATSYRSTDGSRTSYETASYPYDAYDSIVLPRRASHSQEPTFQFLRKQDLEQVHHHHQQQQQQHQQQQHHQQQQQQQHQSQYTHGYENGYVPFETHSLPRRTCIHHKPEEFHTHTLPRRDHGHGHHHHEIVYRDQSHPALPAPEHLILSNGSVNQDVRSFDSMPSATNLNRRMSAHAIVLPPEKQHQQHSTGLPLVQGLHQQQQQQVQQQQQQQQRRASYAFVTADTQALAKRNSIPHQQIQKVQPIMQAQFATPVKTQAFQPLVKPQPPILPSHYTSQTAPPSCPVTPPNIQPLDMQDDTKSSSEGSCSTCESESEPELDGPSEEREIFIDFKPRVSPIPSPGAVKKKKLQKTQSEGELLHAERRKASVADDGDGGSSTVPTGSDDEGRSTMREHTVPPKLPKQDYRDASESSVPDDEPQVIDRRKESFRKRSVSLDQPTSCEQEDDDDQRNGSVAQQRNGDGGRTHPHGAQRMSSRSRSISAAIGSRHLSAPPSPQKEDHSASTGRLHREVSPFHSSDSLANDATRDTSDGNWNESQATIMTTSLTDNGKLTPSARRKNLLLQHQQRSSMDTDALDMEDIADQPLPPLPVTVASTALQTNTVSTPSCHGHQQPNGTAIQPTVAGVGIVKPTTPSIAVIPSPSMEREERDLQWQKSATLRRPSRPLSPTKRAARNEQQLQQKQQKMHKIEPLIHRSSDTSDRTGKSDPSPTSSMPSGSGGPTTPQQPSPSSTKLPHHHPIGVTTPVAARFTKGSPGNGVDLLKDHPVFSQDPVISVPSGAGGGAGSEGSTTEDYVTCTDNSKRGASGAKGTYKTIHATRPTKQVTATTQDGSSFESASSIYSLARVDAVCEETPPIEEKSVSPQIPPPPIPKPSPTHSVSSSSSDSFSVSKKSSPSRVALPKAIAGKAKPSKPQSLSDDERSEKRYSSSHDEKEPTSKGPYAGSATGTIARSARRGRDWNEEERRRKKSTFKLEFDKDSIKTYTTPMLRQPSPGFKKLSPEDKSALNVLDGASPSSKQKRFRPKTRKSPRARSAVPEETNAGGVVGSTGTLPRRSKTPLVRSPEKPTTLVTVATTTAVVMATPQPTIVAPVTNLSPSQYYSQIRSPPSAGSPRKQKISPEKRLQAISTESLRSVSPGSDSVFYSEADALSHCEQQVHCSHCGKEVEVANIPGESEESILTLDSTDNDRPDIVQPPEGFADSPDCTKTPHHTRLYKKMDKRFRSEDRHVDRRHFKSRQEYRAKSEERGKEEVEPNNLRPAGSSPCVAPAGQAYIDTTSEPEQGVYHGNYKAGLWICIADRDVWRRNELPDGSFERPKDATLERRGSTDSERDFRKKYQAITHRLVHRKSCVEMYRRQNSNSFDTDKTVVVCRKSGEFGFRIHGSKPVVVSAIEPDTPAETSGLEVGDIVLSVNGISVIDKSHSEVVKIAHAGSDTLELEVARTIGMLSPLDDGSTHPSIYTGFLWRYCSSGGKWVRRWFSLRPDHCLYYYKSDSDNQPIGAIMLTNHTIERIPLEPITRPNSFAIDTEEGTKVQLSADSEEAASRWIAIISHAAQQCDPWLENSGPLTKLGSKWRSWTKRYCVLKDAVLYFYHDGQSKSAFGMACLQGYRVQPSSAGGKKYAFEIVPPELSLRHYYFHTETEMDKKR
uniref:PDZ domain-containing protein n=1 Tax=Anopheles christyi TaxID=43041 RepID=A0A182K3W2_9DIPT